jgi:hypothetical protein
MISTNEQVAAEGAALQQSCLSHTAEHAQQLACGNMLQTCLCLLHIHAFTHMLQTCLCLLHIHAFCIYTAPGAPSYTYMLSVSVLHLVLPPLPPLLPLPLLPVMHALNLCSVYTHAHMLQVHATARSKCGMYALLVVP